MEQAKVCESSPCNGPSSIHLSLPSVCIHCDSPGCSTRRVQHTVPSEYYIFVWI